MWIITVLDHEDISAWPVFYSEDDGLAQQAMKEIAEEHKDHVYNEFKGLDPVKAEISEDHVYCPRPECNKSWTLDGSARRLK